MVLVLGIVKASLKILGIGIGVKKVVLLMSAPNIFYQSATAKKQGIPVSLVCVNQDLSSKEFQFAVDIYTFNHW